MSHALRAEIAGDLKTALRWLQIRMTCQVQLAEKLSKNMAALSEEDLAALAK